MRWTVEFASETAESEVYALPADMLARFLRIGDLIEDQGLIVMREPHVKHLVAKLWEIRVKGRDGIARSIYATAKGQRVIILRTFIKKTQTTPPREIDLALARLKEFKP